MMNISFYLALLKQSNELLDKKSYLATVYIVSISLHCMNIYFVLTFLTCS